MHASSAPRYLPNGCFGRLVRVLCRLVGIDSRRCFCIRCVATRSGIFRRTRTRVGHRAYANMHLLGIRIIHRFAYELPVTAPPVSPPGGRPTSGQRPWVTVIGRGTGRTSVTTARKPQPTGVLLTANR